MAWIDIVKKDGFSPLSRGKKKELIASLEDNEIPIGSYKPNTEYRIDRQSDYMVNKENFQGGEAFE